MDNQTAQEMLSVYRPDGEDAHDPVLRDALDQSARDPRMRAWFEREQVFDAEVTAALESMDVPRAGKDRLLQLAARLETGKPQADVRAAGNGTRSSASRRWWRACIGLAAALIISLMVWQSFFRPIPPALHADGFSMGGLIASGMPLSYRNDDPDAVISWLAARSAPAPKAFPGTLAQAATLGCRIFELPEGGKISLICLLNNGEVVHYFVFDQQASELLAYAPMNSWWNEQGWNLYSFEQGDYRIAMATQGEPANLL